MGNCFSSGWVIPLGVFYHVVAANLGVHPVSTSENNASFMYDNIINDTQSS